MKKVLTAVASIAMTIGLVSLAPSASADETVTLRPADVTHEDTRSAGHNDFLSEGVRVHTDDNTSNAKATGYYNVGLALDSLSGVSQDWAGTEPQPGMQLVVTDADGNAGILVYEPIYNGDLWLTNGSAQALKDAAPSHTGGSGTDNHGTLAEWQAATDLTVVSGGWSLGSGVKGSGVLLSQTYGGTTFTFTKADAPAEQAKPIASAMINKPKPTVAKVNVTATQPEGTVPTPKGAFYRVLKTVKGAAADDVITSDEIVRYLAKGRVREGSDDAMRFTFKHDAKVTVVSYGTILDDAPVQGARHGWDRHSWDRTGR
jgi:hypothetical protein